MESKDFAVFILSHGRADTISTYRALRDGGRLMLEETVVHESSESLSFAICHPAKPGEHGGIIIAMQGSAI